MREILFRGKRIDNGEWVCSGNLIHFNEDNECYIPVVNSKCTCTHDENDNIIEWNQVMFCKVSPETVGQCTGLTDKNGKKIFEGDIMPVWENGEKYHYKVIYNGDCFMLSMLDSEQGSYPLSVKNSISEIIGNIHDNPELLRTPQNDEVRE